MGFLEKFTSRSPRSTTDPVLMSQYIYNAGLALLFNRCFTATMSICLLGLTAFYISTEQRTDDGVHTGVKVYIAAAVLSILGTLYGLSLSFPLLRDQPVQIGQSEAYTQIVRKRWTLLGIDVVLLVLWIAAAAVAQGAVPHYNGNGVSLTALGAVMVVFEVWAIAIVLFSRGFKFVKK